MHIDDLFGVELPIIQAPMAGVQDTELALAVAAAGGLGSLPCGMLSDDQLRRQLTLIQAQTQRPINLNFFCHREPVVDEKVDVKWQQRLAPYFNEYDLVAADIPAVPSRQPFSHRVADVIEPFRPRVISFHFGLPEAELVARVKAWGATVLASATTLPEALWLEANGADVIIAQGVEAGGHRGMFLTDDLRSQQKRSVLLAELLANISLPVVAAGGIVDAAGVAAALSQGAVAAQVGTAYLLCREAKTSALHRQAIMGEGGHFSAITNLFSGRPARGIINRVIKEQGAMATDVPAYPLASRAMSALRKQAEVHGSSDFSPLWCGQDVSGCREISAAALTTQLAAELASS